MRHPRRTISRNPREYVGFRHGGRQATPSAQFRGHPWRPRLPQWVAALRVISGGKGKAERRIARRAGQRARQIQSPSRAPREPGGFGGADRSPRRFSRANVKRTCRGARLPSRVPFGARPTVFSGSNSAQRELRSPGRLHLKTRSQSPAPSCLGCSRRTRIQWSVLPFLWISAGASFWVRLLKPASMTVCLLSPTVHAARCVVLSTAP